MTFNHLIHVCFLMLLHIVIYDTDPTMTSLLVCLFSTVDQLKGSMHMMWTFLTSLNSAIIIYKKYALEYIVIQVYRDF